MKTFTYIFLLFIISTSSVIAADDKGYLYGEKAIALEKMIEEWWQQVVKGESEKYLDLIYWDGMKEKEKQRLKKELTEATKYAPIIKSIKAISSSAHDKYAVVYVFITHTYRSYNNKIKIDTERVYLIKIGDSWKMYPPDGSRFEPKIYKALTKIAKYLSRVIYYQDDIKKNLSELLKNDEVTK